LDPAGPGYTSITDNEQEKQDGRDRKIGSRRVQFQ
jgi:hypothetical protein